VAHQSHLDGDRLVFVTPQVSVIVPAHQAELTLASAVSSVLNAQTISLELIVVNDCSSDATAVIAEGFRGDDRVTVVQRTSNGGPSVARNDGLRRARGEFVLFLDADDQLEPGALEVLVTTCDTASAALGRFRAVDESGGDVNIGTWATEQLRPVVRRHGQFVASPEGYTSEAVLTRLVTPPPGGVLVRRSAAMALGGYDVTVKRSEDLDFMVRLVSLGRVVATNAVVLRYCRRETQRSAGIRGRQFGRQRTLVQLVWHAPSRNEARARARGVTAHHLDRAATRWRFGERQFHDVVVVSRSLVLAVAFSVEGYVAGWRAPRAR
jgi:glycosyltransferase involved in cell wall biosynthesis